MYIKWWLFDRCHQNTTEAVGPSSVDTRLLYTWPTDSSYKCAMMEKKQHCYPSFVFLFHLYFGSWFCDYSLWSMSPNVFGLHIPRVLHRQTGTTWIVQSAAVSILVSLSLSHVLIPGTRLSAWTSKIITWTNVIYILLHKLEFMSDFLTFSDSVKFPICVHTDSVGNMPKNGRAVSFKLSWSSWQQSHSATS